MLMGEKPFVWQTLLMGDKPFAWCTLLQWRHIYIIKNFNYSHSLPLPLLPLLPLSLTFLFTRWPSSTVLTSWLSSLAEKKIHMLLRFLDLASLGWQSKPPVREHCEHSSYKLDTCTRCFDVQFLSLPWELPRGWKKKKSIQWVLCRKCRHQTWWTYWKVSNVCKTLPDVRVELKRQPLYTVRRTVLSTSLFLKHHHHHHYHDHHQHHY